MQKILLASILAAMSTVALAGGPDQQQQQQSNSAAISAAQGGDQEQGINNSGNVAIGCLIDCGDNGDAARAAGDADIAVALINADAARDVAGTTVKIKNTPSMSSANLVSSNDTCMGSASGAVTAPGLGIALGKTYTDTNCVMLKNSRELWNMGMRAAALALMCNDSANRDALELTGFECAQTTAARKGNVHATAPASATQPVAGVVSRNDYAFAIGQ